MRVPRTPWAAFALAICCAVGEARADDTTPSAGAAAEATPWKRWAFHIGGYLSRLDSTVRLGSDAAGASLEVNLEDAFNLDSATRDVRAGGYYRIGASLRHRIAVDYFGNTRVASKTLEDDVTIGDTTFPAGTTVSAETSLRIIKATYAYSFFLDDRVDLAASAGIYTMPFSFSFEGVSTNEKQDFTAPLPVVGLHLDFAIKPNVFLRQRLDLFYLEYGQFKGGLGDISIAVEWFPWKNVGFALGYESLRIGIEATGSDYPEMELKGNVKYQQNGMFIYVTVAN